ncbi:UDP-glucuronosyltransferase 2B31-like isoform X2 [Erinaceus europaeus]|uniref:glucuronosyltransferase n=1 Tax=Erinaceus europaeus TaxID=9365 RepID=A0ABM3X4R0_ERIEU|nr:UDP-glucuronosyltransferase 2B31-like isoform X2 [Erinaceus europaeus]
MPVKLASLFLLLQVSCYINTGNCGKVLVWPMEYSHWINLKTILDELVTKGHEVTVLTSSVALFHDPKKQSAIKFEIYPTTFTKDALEIFYTEWTRNWTNLSKNKFWIYFPKMEELLWIYSDVYEKLCKEVVSNKKFMTKLQESRFELLLADAVGPCGELLAELLKLPLVYSLRFTPGFSFEKHVGGLPLPPSYVPVVMSELSDKMTFMERIQNMIYTLYFDFYFQVFNEKSWNKFYSEILGRPTTLSEIMGKAEKWLIRTYWDFEFPHPLLPHFEYVGGLHCKPAKPLPKEIEEFVQSSGENGIVVFTLGSMIKDMSEERANMIASALAQIPQKKGDL